jgi:hypothetical protein
MNSKMMKVRSVIASLAAVICTSFAGNTWARNVSGTIDYLELRVAPNSGAATGPNNVIVRVAATPTGAGCAASTNFTPFFTFNAEDARGKNILSVLTAAYLAGRSVSITGTGACGVYVFGAGTANVEAIDRVSANP